MHGVGDGCHWVFDSLELTVYFFKSFTGRIFASDHATNAYNTFKLESDVRND